MYKNLVLSGGFLKGTALLGAVRYLEEHDELRSIKQLIGTSSGSLICFFIAIGYKSQEICEIIKNEVLYLIDVKFDINNLLALYTELGFDSGENMRRLIKSHLNAKLQREAITFKELQDLTGYSLIITGSNITQKRVEYFNVENHPDMNVVDAVMISCCIPPMYKPIRYQGDIYVDGGVYENFPLRYLKNIKNNTNKNVNNSNDTLGISLRYSVKGNDNPNLIEYVSNIVTSVMDKLNYDGLNLDDFNICYIDFDDDLLSDLEICYNQFCLVIKNDKINEYFKYGYEQFRIYTNRLI